MKQKIWRLLENAVLETLEDRQMMSAAPLSPISLDHGVLTLNADPSAHTRLTVDYASNGGMTAYVGTPAGKTVQSFTSSQVKQIAINGGDGPEYIFIDPHITAPATIHTGDGNTTVRAGGGNDTIYAGAGNDDIHVVHGNNVIYAGTGNDSITGGKGDHDTIYAGSGHDRIDAGGGFGVILGAKSTDDVFDAPHTTMLKAPSQVPPTTVGKSGGTISKSGGGTTKGTTSGSGTTKSGSTGSSSTPVSVAPVSGSTPVGVTAGSGSRIVINPNAPKPTPKLELLDGVRQTGVAVNVNALNSTPGAGSVINGNYQWDFGDSSGVHNTITGWTAAHVYDKPGSYTITLTITNAAGGVATATQQVNIAAATRNQLFVDPVNGSDSNSGSQASPFRSANQAFNKLSDNTEILFKAGGKYDVTASLVITKNNVLIGRYGSGNDPILNRIKGNYNSTISVGSGTNSVTIQNITFDSPYGVSANAAAPKIGVSGINLAGSNIAVRGCTFLNVDDAINENGSPTGVLIADNNAPLATGVRGYFVWAQGQQQTIINNTAVNSTREHIVRMVDFDNVTVEGNNFDNQNRVADSGDYSKGCIEMHVGQYAYVTQNTITGGDIRTGPLGLWGESASNSTDWCVIEDNQLTDTFVSIATASHHVMASNNVVTNSTGTAFIVGGLDDAGHESMDITINNNTAVNSGTTGRFVQVQGPVKGITMDNNLFVAPNLVLTSGGNAPVYVQSGAMNSFTQISNNVWPDPGNSDSSSIQGGINFVGNNGVGNELRTADQWNDLSQVGNDSFTNVSLGDTYEVSLNTLLAGSTLARAA